MSLCPNCSERERRRPGAWCTPCDVERTKARRHGARVVANAPRPREVFDRVLTGRRFLVTSAQNATPVHAEFWEALKVAAQHLDAELIVIPLRYKNPTSLWSSKQADDDWWDPELVPFLINQRKRLGKHIVLVGDVKVQPTASSPLTGFESLTGAESCLIGHPKMQFRSVPVPSGRFPKILSTTGSVTTENFTDSKAGALGAFHHYLGAVIVETRGKYFWLRQLNADHTDGSFIDVDKLYSPTGVKPAPPAAGLVLGDVHVRFTSPDVDRATFGPRGIVKAINPETVVSHDTDDNYAVNPHHRNNPFVTFVKHAAHVGSVREELKEAFEWIRARTEGRQAVLVPSNHDNFLERWVIDADWKTNPVNAEFYLETALAMLRSAKLTPQGTKHADPFVYWAKKLAPKLRVLESGESFTIAGIECGQHGDDGPNGARATVKNLASLGVRLVTGHGHAPAIEQGHYRVGTSTPLRLEYTHGPSSWLNAHCVIYANGKRALLTIIDGEWRA